MAGRRRAVGRIARRWRVPAAVVRGPVGDTVAAGTGTGQPENLALMESRSYRPLPAVLGKEGEWEGGAILREIPSPTGICLFGTIRDVMLWLPLPADRRSGAFSPGARAVRARQLPKDAAPDLAGHLTRLLGICDGEIIRPEEVSAVCLAIASWAQAGGALQTELAFRQAAALGMPADAALSLATAGDGSDAEGLERGAPVGAT